MTNMIVEALESPSVGLSEAISPTIPINDVNDIYINQFDKNNIIDNRSHENDDMDHMDNGFNHKNNNNNKPNKKSNDNTEKKSFLFNPNGKLKLKYESFFMHEN